MKQRLRLLIVDDCQNDADLLLRTLSRGGYQVDHERVDSAAGMRTALENGEWDIITSDHAMPEFNATAALELAKQLRPDVPFIIVSGEIGLNQVVSLMKGGAQDYIQKRELARLVPAIGRELREVGEHRRRKRIEAALQASETRYRSLFETAKDGILILEGETGRIADVNPSLVNMSGYDYADLIGRELWKTGMFVDMLASKRAFNELQKRGYIRNDDLPLKTENGGRIDVEFIGNVYMVDGKKVVQCNIRDISDRKKAEGQVKILDSYLEARAAELEAANRQLEAFNYTVSHDLRAPLTNIHGFCQVIMEQHGSGVPDDCKDYLKEISNSVMRMNRLIDSLLNFSLVTRRELHKEVVDLAESARSIAAELRLSEPRRQVMFSIAEKVTVYGDGNLLQVVMDNLLGNAWKYTRKTAQARIEFGVTSQAGKAVCFVRDNGAGFDMAHAEKLFKPFQRLDEPEEFEGFGIGLATVKRIIDSHGGWIAGEGEVGKGATFYFSV